MADTIDTRYHFAAVNPNDHAGLIYIAAFLTLTYTNLTFLTRLFVKWHVFGFDDWAMCVAQASNMVQIVLLLISLSSGLGKSYETISDSSYARMASTEYANQVVLYLSLGLSKCASVMLVQRLFTREARQFWIICNIVTVVMIIWTVFAAFMVSVGCSPPSIAPTTKDQICPSIYSRYQIVVITDVITDVILILAPAYLVWQLQMSQKLKFQVIAVFTTRVPLIPLSILGLIRFKQSLYSNNPGVDRTPVILFQQTEICYSLMAATIPSLKAFIRSFDTGSGVKVGTTNAYGSSGGYGGGQSYQMKSLSGKNSATRSHSDEAGDVIVSNKPFDKEHDKKRGNSTTQITSSSYPARKSREEDASGGMGYKAHN
ncbi:hypothetical protein P154DRAFT_551938 [Amniculicola lignicola CBS 123094]|uniref:Rhodopsin domain-containing protein n=1 Tax=Amniculicola lignicola CBS 123094 TaxID=1392246 RepID=A0A6A5WSS0_9PLEO|nr:hypothetical protein P154DRAFT_551938 [Amniculicola lignicola CBS 123094]